ncbi:MAG: ABC transporter permease [Anaerolineae bacterium]|nr:ABC transporter permease [Anaerolineae bacterium]
MSALLWKANKDVPTWIRQHIQYLLIPIVLGLFLWFWETLIIVQNYPSFILPSPREVAQSWAEYWQRGIFPYHLSITLFEVLLGFGIALTFASSVGYLLAKMPLLEKIVSPYLVATQAIPLVAIAPLIIIWISTGIVQNALIAALISFFPMLINTIIGVRGIRDEYRALMRSYAATRWQVFSKLEVPAALPVFLGGVRVGVTLSVIGVVVAELMWADRGLGFLINFAQGQLDTPLLFATVVTLSMMAITLYVTVVLIEKIFLRWRRNVQ